MVATRGSGWVLAPSLVGLVAEADHLWPARARASDGSIGDTAHAARTSDHNISEGYVHAVDLTHDPAHGVDMWTLANQIRARRDPRVQYVISGHGTGDLIWNPDISNDWRETGKQSHDGHHLHVSIRHSNPARNDTSPWWPTHPGEDFDVDQNTFNLWFTAALANTLDKNGPTREEFKKLVRDAIREALTKEPGRSIRDELAEIVRNNSGG